MENMYIDNIRCIYIERSRGITMNIVTATIVKMLILMINIHGTLSEKKYESILVAVVEVLYDMLDTKNNVEQNFEKDISEQFKKVIKNAVFEMEENLDTCSMRAVWEQKEASLIYELEKLDWMSMELDECKETIKKIFVEESPFDVRLYTEKEYQVSAEQFFEHWIHQLGGQSQASTQILVKSILGIYTQIAAIGNKQEKQISRRLISKETKRPKNSFNKESRSNEIKQLVQVIKENEKVGLLSGIGGIGKTEICKYLFHTCYINNMIEGIEYIGWLTYRGNLMQTFYEQVLCKKDQESFEKGYYDVLKYLQSLGNKLLLFVDNIDNSMVEDSKLKHLFDLNCKLVITSRIQQFDSIKSINIGSLEKKWAKVLFYTFYRGKEDEKCFEEIFNLTKGHPLSIELIAKTAYSEGLTLENMVCKLKNTGFALPEIKSNVIYEEYNKILIKHLNRIFSVAKLSNRYKQILYRLALFPINQISIENLIEWKIGKMREDFEILSYRGWIFLDCDGVIMHPVISDAIHTKSSKQYSVYQNMYIAMGNELELLEKNKAHEKYLKMLMFYYVVRRRKFQKLEYAELLNQIGVILNKMGEQEDAAKLLENAIIIKEKCTSEKSTLFTGYNNLALAYGRNNLRKNLICCQKAESIGRELFEEDAGEYALKFATTLNNLSLSYLNNGDLENAEIRQKESINIKLCYFGERCIALAQSYSNMAIVKKRQKKYDEAYEFQKKAIDINESPDYAVHLFNMAGIEKIRGNDENAIYYLEKAIELWEEDSNFYYYKLTEAYKRYLELLKSDIYKNNEKILLASQKMCELKKEDNNL